MNLWAGSKPTGGRISLSPSISTPVRRTAAHFAGASTMCRRMRVRAGCGPAAAGEGGLIEGVGPAAPVALLRVHGEVEARHALDLFARLVRKARGRPCLERRLVRGKTRVAVDAEHRPASPPRVGDV